MPLLAPRDLGVLRGCFKLMELEGLSEELRRFRAGEIRSRTCKKRLSKSSDSLLKRLFSSELSYLYSSSSVRKETKTKSS
jgi:hypothetical protein